MATRLACLFLAVLLLCSGCYSGPWRLSSSWHDNTQDWYSNNAWVHGALLGDIIPVYPIVGLVLGITDLLFVNPFYFWTRDAWSNKGTAFVHEQPTGPNVTDDAFESNASGWKPKTR